MKRIRTFQEFKDELSGNEELQNELKNSPESVLNKFIQDNPIKQDKWIYRLVVLGLCITIISITIGVICLVYQDNTTTDKDIPTILTSLGSAAIGAIAGLLAPQPNNN